MPSDPPPSEQCPPRRGDRSARTVRRAWRRRSRRAQVSAVATILGLLLVVTFIANYIATTLPNTMGQNDLEHEVQVENQVSQLSALLQATAVSSAVGAQLSQPVSLGSQGAPPFAGPDGASLTPLASASNQSGYFPQATVNFTLAGPSGTVVYLAPATQAGFVVHLANTYVPASEVAFDEGSVIYAQPGSFPIFVVPPRLSLSNHVLSIFFPRFANSIPSEAGVGTADVVLQVLSVTTLKLPTPNFSLRTGSDVNITVVSPYAAAWYSNFEGTTALAPYASCSGPSSVCTSLYNPTNLLGTVKLSIPTSGLTLQFVSGLYSVTLR